MSIQILKGASPKLKYYGTILDPAKTRDREKIAQAITISPQSFNGAYDKKKDSTHAMTIIERLNPDQQTAVLASNEVILWLVYGGQKDRIIALIGSLAPEQQAKIFKAQYVVGCFHDGNSYKRMKSERSSQIIGMIEALPSDLQFSVLSTPYVVNNLGWKESLRIVRLIERMPTEQQVEVLNSDQAISRLTERGQGSRVLNIIKKLPPESQCEVLSTSNIVYDLAHNSSPTIILSMIRKMTADRQARILAADRTIQGLHDNGYGEAVIKLIAKLSPQQQVAALTAEFAVYSLMLRDTQGDVIDLMEKLPPALQLPVMAAIKEDAYYNPDDEQRKRLTDIQENIDAVAGFDQAVEQCKGDKHKAALGLVLRHARSKIGHSLGYDKASGEIVVPHNMIDGTLPTLPNRAAAEKILVEAIARYNIPVVYTPRLTGARLHCYFHMGRGL